MPDGEQAEPHLSDEPVDNAMAGSLCREPPCGDGEIIVRMGGAGGWPEAAEKKSTPGAVAE